MLTSRDERAWTGAFTSHFLLLFQRAAIARSALCGVHAVPVGAGRWATGQWKVSSRKKLGWPNGKTRGRSRQEVSASGQSRTSDPHWHISMLLAGEVGEK